MNKSIKLNLSILSYVIQLRERGPYVYKQTTQKINVSFKNNKRSSKTWKKGAKFYKEESCKTCKEDDEVFIIVYSAWILSLTLYLSWYSQGAIIRVLMYRRYANITVWYFFVFSQVPVGTQNSCYLRTYFLLVPHDQAQGIQYRNLVGISCVWDVLAWNMIALMALRNVGVGCLK